MYYLYLLTDLVNNETIQIIRTLKTIISKYFLYTKTTKWLDQIDSIISIYNDTPHRSLDYLTPTEASEDSHYQQILDINIAKNKVNKLNQISDLKPDDKVRIKLVGTFFVCNFSLVFTPPGSGPA